MLHMPSLGREPAAWTLNKACEIKKQLKTEYDAGNDKPAAVLLECQEAMAMEAVLSAYKQKLVTPDRMKCFIPLHGWQASEAVPLACTTQRINAAVLVSCFLLMHSDVPIACCTSWMHAAEVCRTLVHIMHHITQLFNSRNCCTQCGQCKSRYIILGFAAFVSPTRMLQAAKHA